MIYDLKKLWKTVFEDDSSIINSFFDIFYAPELTAVHYENNTIASAAYVMPAGYFINGLQREKCAHIYAVSVLPEFRGRGFGISVTNNAVALAYKSGYTSVVLHPANDGLFQYYEKHCKFSSCFSASVSTFHITPDILTPVAVDAYTYSVEREKYLSGTPHIALSPDLLRFFQCCGGKLYSFDNCCAAVEICGNTTYIREILGEISEHILSAIAETTTCIMYTPGNEAHTGMMHCRNTPLNCWMGLTME